MTPRDLGLTCTAAALAIDLRSMSAIHADFASQLLRRTNSRTSVPIVSLMSGTTLIGLAILLFGQGRVERARHRIS